NRLKNVGQYSLNILVPTRTPMSIPVRLNVLAVVLSSSGRYVLARPSAARNPKSREMFGASPPESVGVRKTLRTACFALCVNVAFLRGKYLGSWRKREANTNVPKNWLEEDLANNAPNRLP